MEIVGVSREPGRGVTDDVGLYEFWTDTSVPVRLHDMDFQSLHSFPASRRLVLRFVYDAASIPPEAAATPVAVLTFDGVHLLQVREDADAFEHPQETWSQVTAFDYEPSTGTLALFTFTMDLVFTADLLTVALAPGWTSTT